jgi:trigger factor
MNITEQKTGDLTATIKIEVKESDYSDRYKKELNNYRRQAVMPGFRQGKVPAGIIEKKYGNAILMEELNKLISETLTNHIRENNLKLLGYPLPNYEISIPDYQRQKDFDFYFDIGYSPEINLDFEKIDPVDYYKIIIDDEQVDDQIQRIRERNGKLEDQEDVQEKDTVDTTFVELDSEGKEKEIGINGEGMIMVEKITDDAIKDQFIGSKPDDIVIFNPMKAIGNATDVAALLNIEKEAAENLETDFQFTIKTIKRNIPAEINEELFKAVFPKTEIKTEKEFREQLKKDMGIGFGIESEKLFGRLAMDKIMESVTIDLPEDFIAKWLYHSNEGKLSHEEISKNLSGYISFMKIELLENKFIENKPELKVTDEDIKDVVKNYFRQYLLPQGESTEEMDEMLENQLNMMADNYLKEKNKETEKISEDLFNQRLSAHLNTVVPKVEKSVTMDEFVKQAQSITSRQEHDHAHDHEHDHDHDHEHDHEHDHNHNHEHDSDANIEKTDEQS